MDFGSDDEGECSLDGGYEIGSVDDTIRDLADAIGQFDPACSTVSCRSYLE